MRQQAAWWAERVAEVEAGDDAVAVARRHGVRLVTLRWWCSEMRRRARASTMEGPRLLPVVVKGDVALRAASSSERVVVEVGALRMSLPGDARPEQLAAIVAAAMGAC